MQTATFFLWSRSRPYRLVEPLIFGGTAGVTYNDEDYRFVTVLGLLRIEQGTLVPANRMYAEIIGRYLSCGEQDSMQQSVPETPWATEDGLDMPGLMAAFQAFWRENSGADRRAYWMVVFDVEWRFSTWRGQSHGRSGYTSATCSSTARRSTSSGCDQHKVWPVFRRNSAVPKGYRAFPIGIYAQSGVFVYTRWGVCVHKVGCL